jgi:hypothetical protein
MKEKSARNGADFFISAHFEVLKNGRKKSFSSCQ